MIWIMNYDVSSFEYFICKWSSKAYDSDLMLTDKIDTENNNELWCFIFEYFICKWSSKAFDIDLMLTDETDTENI